MCKKYHAFHGSTKSRRAHYKQLDLKLSRLKLAEEGSKSGAKLKGGQAHYCGPCLLPLALSLLKVDFLGKIIESNSLA